MIKKSLHHLKKQIIKSYKKNWTAEGGFDSKLPDYYYIKQLYKIRVGKTPDLQHPRLFTEKCNWLKLYDRRPEYTDMVDKYRVRSIIEKKIGKEYLVPLIGVWKQAKDIEFNTLPNQFVLKCNHNSNVYVCTDKSKKEFEDKSGNIIHGWDQLKEEIDNNMKSNYYKKCREWPYKNVKKCIICEKYMQNTNGEELVDYKLFCFNGKPKLFMINSNRFQPGGVMVDIYDMDWNHLEMQDGHYPFRGDVFEKPKMFDEFVKLSQILSEGIPFLRVDFNIWDNKIYFGELTFFHSAGFESFQPDKWDTILGDWLILPKKKRR